MYEWRQGILPGGGYKMKISFSTDKATQFNICKVPSNMSLIRVAAWNFGVWGGTINRLKNEHACTTNMHSQTLFNDQLSI